MTRCATVKLTEKELNALLHLCNEFAMNPYLSHPTREQVKNSQAVDRAAQKLCDGIDKVCK